MDSRQSLISSAPVGAKRPVCPGERHHHARRPAGEIRGLVKIWRRFARRRDGGVQPLFQAKRGFVILIVIGDAPDLSVAGRAIECDGGGVVLAHLQPQEQAVSALRFRLGRLEQFASEAVAGELRGDRDGIQTRQRGAAPEEHQCVADQRAIGLGDKQDVTVAGEEGAKRPARNPVGHEHARFERFQRIEIVAPREPDRQLRHGVRKHPAANRRSANHRPRRPAARAFVCRFRSGGCAGRAGGCGIFTQCSAPARIPEPYLVHCV